MNIHLEHLRIFLDTHPVSMVLVIPQSKTDRHAHGQTKRLEALPRLCPIAALQDWIAASFVEKTGGPVFVKIDRWGNLGEKSLSKSNVNKVLRNMLRNAGLDAAQYSSHSLRSGVANWITRNGGTLEDSMQWVGWKDERSAQRYQRAFQSVPSRLMTQALMSR